MIKTPVILVLVVLLSASLSYIVYGQYQEKQDEIYNQGAQDSFQATVLEIARVAITCQQVPLIIGNQTINMIAVDCLQQDEK